MDFHCFIDCLLLIFGVAGLLSCSCFSLTMICEVSLVLWLLGWIKLLISTERGASSGSSRSSAGVSWSRLRVRVLGWTYCEWLLSWAVLMKAAIPSVFLSFPPPSSPLAAVPCFLDGVELPTLLITSLISPFLLSFILVYRLLPLCVALSSWISSSNELSGKAVSLGTSSSSIFFYLSF